MKFNVAVVNPEVYCMVGGQHKSTNFLIPNPLISKIELKVKTHLPPSPSYMPCVNLNGCCARIENTRVFEGNKWWIWYCMREIVELVENSGGFKAPPSLFTNLFRVYD